MHLPATQSWVVLLVTIGGLNSVACQGAQPRHAKAPALPDTSVETADSTVRDAAWQTRAAVVSVDPGNSVTHRRSESTFSTRTSRASVDAHTSSLLVQVAALNPSVAQKPPLVEQQLRDMGLQVIGQRRSKLRQPNNYNVLVEDVTYVEEVQRKNTREPVEYTIIPAVHVRVISANERTTIEGTPIPVKINGTNLSPSAADTYGRKLAIARAELGKQLVHWLEPRLQLPASHEETLSSSQPTATKRRPQTFAHNEN